MSRRCSERQCLSLLRWHRLSYWGHSSWRTLVDVLKSGQCLFFTMEFLAGLLRGNNKKWGNLTLIAALAGSKVAIAGQERGFYLFYISVHVYACACMSSCAPRACGCLWRPKAVRSSWCNHFFGRTVGSPIMTWRLIINYEISVNSVSLLWIALIT